MKSYVPIVRIRHANTRPVDPDGRWVVYWMIACRRAGWSYALQRAVDWAVALGRPLLILEPLRCDYPWASDRLHRFVIDGMAATADRVRGRNVMYYPFLELEPGGGRGLLAALAEPACVVITDEFPGFFLPRMVRSAAAALPTRLEVVDGTGLLPLASADRAHASAVSFRRFVQRTLPGMALELPQADPLGADGLPPPATIPSEITHRWPIAEVASLASEKTFLQRLPIDHSVASAPIQGGSAAGEAALAHFVAKGLPRYAEMRNHPDENATSGLSAYLHFGHLSVHHVFAEVVRHERWSEEDLAATSRGQREGWWGMSAGAEAFLDQLVTWRELAFNTAWFADGHDQYDSLPEWARQTLAVHARDPRPYRYHLEELAAGATHDRLWNAAANQLAGEGRLHGYLRMLWGKKILEWTSEPREALEVMLELNDRFALDGRGPNSVAGIFWVLGRYDRPWPERAVFGRVRSMSSQRTAKKVRLARYLERYAPLRAAGEQEA